MCYIERTVAYGMDDAGCIYALVMDALGRTRRIYGHFNLVTEEFTPAVTHAPC